MENEVKDLNLKVIEQDKKMEIISKKLSILKEKENKLEELQGKFDELLKGVDKMASNVPEKENEVEIDKKTIKCNKCEFIAESDDGLKVHTKTKHTEQDKIKCWKCDFTFKTKIELTAHNDKYWYFHRMFLHSNHKRCILEEFEDLKKKDLQ